MDSIAAAHSGHMGLPLGAAEIGATLYGGMVSIFSLSNFDYELFSHLMVLSRSASFN